MRICNLDFLFAGLIVLAFVYIKLISNRGDSRYSFLNLSILAGLVTLSFAVDLFVSSPLLLDFPEPAPEALIGFLVILQCVTLAFFCNHIIDLTGDYRNRRIEIVLLALLPLLAVIILLMANIHTHVVFTFNPDENSWPYAQFGFAPFLCMGFYSVMTGAIVIIRRRFTRRNYMICALIASVLTLAALVIEYCDPTIRVLSFSFALGLAIFAAAELNPYEYLDSLTHAFDINGFRSKIRKLHRRRKRFSVVFVSLGHLSELRLIAGSQATDELFRQCANTCRRVGRTNKVYRVRSSIFAIITFSHHEEQRVVRGMQSFFSSSNVISGTEITPHGNVVVIDQACKLDSIEQCGQYLEFIMDELKRDEIMDSDSAATLQSFLEYQQIRIFLKKAMDHDLFDVYFQPSWCMIEQRFCSLEALAHLPHPEYGAIPPAEFINIAEDEGYISRLDRLQFIKVCKFAQQHEQELRDLRINSIKINLSPIDLLNEDLGNWLVSTMQEYDVDPSIIQFEVTETSATQYDDELGQIIELLSKNGSSLVMDDFGSGYANLKAILTLPFSVVKLDRSLLLGLEDSENSRMLYSSIVTMLHGLGFRVIAEGVETKSQVDILSTFGVDEIQGFYYAHPVPVSELFDLLKKGFAVG